MVRKIVLLNLLAVIMAACTTVETMKWVGVGGSKADGTVIMGIDVPPKMGIRETEVQWDGKQANAEANRRCQNWGYSNAEIFNDSFPVQVICYPQGISPCWSKAYRITYQCIGGR
ncbi:hypothetical protein SKTS_19220 [Sulfurimicrobium lacus]|uniref:Lipoprotein n=2 Tax=Sulfurimicrobium lacus TaxID=2715678 RepID=A0A6F8VDE0_9PROT|nr:hypothetical protein SKTS_19220 [Sulfurimicrobium lacus]